MKSVLTTSNPCHFGSELNNVLGFTNTDSSEGTHKVETPVKLTSIDKFHLKFDYVDNSFF